MEFIDLTDFFTTKSQAVDFSARLAKVSEKIYEVSFNLEKSLQEQFGIRKKDKFLSLLRENNIQSESGSAISNFLTKIQELISSLPTASVTLAIEPNEEILKAISNWFLLNLKRQVLIETLIDPNIIGGAKAGFQGKQLDASIRSVFNDVCLTILNN